LLFMKTLIYARAERTRSTRTAQTRLKYIVLNCEVKLVTKSAGIIDLPCEELYQSIA